MIPWDCETHRDGDTVNSREHPTIQCKDSSSVF